MKIKAKKSELVEALKKVYPLCSNRVQPVLNNVLIKITSKGVELIGSNSTIDIKTSLECEIIEPGSALFPASKLFQIIDTLNDDIEIVCEQELKKDVSGAEFIIFDSYIKSGKIKAKLQSEDVKNYPSQLFKGKFISELIVKSDTLLSGIQKTILSTENTTNNNLLSGINIVINNERVNFYTTTGNIASHYFEEINSVNNIDIILPSDSAKEISRTFQNGYELILSISDNSLMISDNNTVMQTRLVNGQFPKVEHFFNQEKPNYFIIDKEYLSSIIKRSQILKTNTKGELNLLKFDIKGMAANISFKDVLIETTMVEKLGDDILVGFNFDLLNIAIKTIEGNNLKLEYSDLLDSYYIQDSNYKYLLMPCQIKK